MTREMKKAFDEFCESWDCGYKGCGDTPVLEDVCQKVFAAGANYGAKAERKICAGIADGVAAKARGKLMRVLSGGDVNEEGIAVAEFIAEDIRARSDKP